MWKARRYEAGLTYGKVQVKGAPTVAQRNESDEDYGAVVAHLNSTCRIITCRAGIQWIVQGHKGKAGWRGHSYHRNRDALLERVQAGEFGQVDPEALRALQALPEWTESRPPVAVRGRGVATAG